MEHAGVRVKLNRADFVEVCGALARQQDAGDAGPGREQRRGGARMAVEHQVLVAPVGADGQAGETFTALTRDISHAGIGLLQRQPVAQNSLLVVRLPRKDKPPLVMLCRAVYVRELADDVHAVGAEFVRETAPPAPAAAEAEADPVPHVRVHKLE